MITATEAKKLQKAYKKDNIQDNIFKFNECVIIGRKLLEKSIPPGQPKKA